MCYFQEIILYPLGLDRLEVVDSASIKKKKKKKKFTVGKGLH